MADFTQNITNSVRCFGPANSTKWGQAAGVGFTMTWGTSKWGEDGVLVTEFIKVVANAPTFSWDRSSVQIGKNLSTETLTPAFEMSSERLAQGDWTIVFTSNESDAENRDQASWTEGSRPDATFTCQAAAGTSWSEA